MTYPLIILGAGASFDFLRREDYPTTDIDLDWWIPPLTNRLFDGTKFQSIITKYGEMNEIVGYIRGKLRNNSNITFEEVLTKLFQERIQQNPSLYKSFIALLFYISELFGTISKKYYRSHNNYDSLRLILSLNGGRAVFVNFNYDLLLEQSFSKSNVQHIDDYLSDPFPIIKIHGAYNWFWTRLVNAFEGEKKGSYEISINGAQYIFEPGEAKSQWILGIHNTSNPQNIRAQVRDPLTAYASHPALALPLFGKNNFVCPQSHIDFLKRKLKEIDRIVVIGWKLGDPFLRNLIVEELKVRSIPIALIGGKNAKIVFDTLEKEFEENIKTINAFGFSDFVSSDSGEKFLGDNSDVE